MNGDPILCSIGMDDEEMLMRLGATGLAEFVHVGRDSPMHRMWKVAGCETASSVSSCCGSQERSR